MLSGKESLAEFLEYVRARGSVTIEHGTEHFVVTISRGRVSDGARRLMIQGGPGGDDGLEMD